jgi:hypothetical protein
MSRRRRKWGLPQLPYSPRQFFSCSLKPKQQPMGLGNMANLLMILLIGLLLNEPAITLDIISQNLNLQPRNGVEIQLQSLQRNDEPIPDTGTIQT